eukprot:3688001-Amphidinium_carterae.1
MGQKRKGSTVAKLVPKPYCLTYLLTGRLIWLVRTANDQGTPRVHCKLLGWMRPLTQSSQRSCLPITQAQNTPPCPMVIWESSPPPNASDPPKPQMHPAIPVPKVATPWLDSPLNFATQQNSADSFKDSGRRQVLAPSETKGFEQYVNGFWSSNHWSHGCGAGCPAHATGYCNRGHRAGQCCALCVSI